MVIEPLFLQPVADACEIILYAMEQGPGSSREEIRARICLAGNGAAKLFSITVAKGTDQSISADQATKAGTSVLVVPVDKRTITSTHDGMKKPAAVG
jgi:hypothetical protein